MYKILVVCLCSSLIACSYASSHSLANKQNVASTVSFPIMGNSFNLYQSAVERYLKGQSLANRDTADIELNQPFNLTANKKVAYQGSFLLFHGLNDSPYVWRDFAKEMTNKGFDVRAILLEGHGSHPRNMLKVNATKWITSAKAHYQSWAKENTGPLYLGGFSMGAVLATSIAIEEPAVKGLFLVSPAFHSQLDDMLKFSWMYSKFKTWLFGQMLTEDNPTKYNSIAINSASAYYDVTQYLKTKWLARTLDIPVLMVHSLNDSVVDVQYSRDLFNKKFINNNNKLLLYTANGNDQKTNDNEELRNSYYPTLRILNQSHLSLINHSNNPLLGQSKKQLICNGNEYPIFLACMKSKNHWYGAQHTQSPDNVSVARSTYNPDFDTIVKRFEAIFISNIMSTE